MGVLLDGSMLREYEGGGNAGDGRGVGHEYVGGTCGSCIVSSADDVLGVSVVFVIRGVGGVCGMGMCLAWAA